MELEMLKCSLGLIPAAVSGQCESPRYTPTNSQSDKIFATNQGYAIFQAGLQKYVILLAFYCN